MADHRGESASGGRRHLAHFGDAAGGIPAGGRGGKRQNRLGRDCARYADPSEPERKENAFRPVGGRRKPRRFRRAGRDPRAGGAAAGGDPGGGRAGAHAGDPAAIRGSAGPCGRDSDPGGRPGQAPGICPDGGWRCAGGPDDSPRRPVLGAKRRRGKRTGGGADVPCRHASQPGAAAPGVAAAGCGERDTKRRGDRCGRRSAGRRSRRVRSRGRRDGNGSGCFRRRRGRQQRCGRRRRARRGRSGQRWNRRGKRGGRRERSRQRHSGRRERFPCGHGESGGRGRRRRQRKRPDCGQRQRGRRKRARWSRSGQRWNRRGKRGGRRERSRRTRQRRCAQRG